MNQRMEGKYSAIKKKPHINDKAAWFRAFQIMRTCFIVFLGRYITRAPRFLTAIWMIKETFLHPVLPNLWDGTILTLGLGIMDYVVILLSVMVMLAAEWYQEKHGVIREALEKQGFLVQWLAILIPLLVLLCFGILRSDTISSEFIYKQF